ncbi:hypothetical protein Q7P35_011180 [Cladosporium inversicolor]
MAGFGFSPSDIAELCKFSYRAYKEAKSAPERYATARRLADCVRLTLDEIPMGSGQMNETTTALGLHLELANDAYKDLDKYLCQFGEHLGQQRRSPVSATGVVARVRWTTDQLDKRVDKLQEAVKDALDYCQLSIISQLSARFSASIQTTLDTPTTDGENAAPADALQPALVVRTDTNFIVSGDYGLQILPGLQMQRTCKYTSQGFRALYMLEHGYDTSDWKANDEQRSARFVAYTQGKLAEIKQLFHEGKVSHLDVDPSGATWLEQKLLQIPWGVGIRWAQYDLLEYIVSRSKKDIEQNPRLLFQVACWIGEGPHLDMLTTLIGLGLDPGNLDPSLFHQWPAFSDPNWQAEAITPDPFGLDFLRQCLQVEPEFAGCDLLMTNLLTGSDLEFEKAAQQWAARGRVQHKNAFGQSALHLAVMFPKRLKRLLELEMPHKVFDSGYTTPLMYAAAYGQSECVLNLIDHDACIDRKDIRNKRYFVDYALVYGHVSLVTYLVQWLRGQGKHEVALVLLNRCIHWTFANGSMWSNSDTLDCLFRLRGDSDMIVGCGTSMHLAQNVRDARVVLRHKFTAVDVLDEKGQTALMRVSRFLDTRLLRDMLDIEADAGMSTHHQDDSGWTALMYLASCMHERHSYPLAETLQLRRTSTVGCMNMLLSRSASPTLTDSCNCPCSPDGCSALSIALHRAVESIGPYDYSASISRAPLDLAIALQTCTEHSSGWATDTVKIFVNFLETGELHTCCARRRVRSGLRPPPSDCATSSNARTHARLATSARNNSLGGLPFQLARLYDVLQRRSQAQHDETRAEKAKRDRSNRGKRQVSGLIVDTVNDHYAHWIVGSMSIPPVLRLDLDAYREWIAWCVAQSRKLFSRRSLEIWARESSTFVDRLEEELVRLA